MGQPSTIPQCAGDTLPRSPSVEGFSSWGLGVWSAGNFHLSASLGMASAPESSPKVTASFVQGLNKVAAIWGPSGTTLTGRSSSRALYRGGQVCSGSVSIVHCSVVSDSVIPWTKAHQAPLSMGFSRQEYWSGLPFPSPGGFPRPRDQTRVSCIAGRFFTI